MFKSSFSILVILFLFFNNNLAQCPEGNVVLSSQAKVNAFQRNYPNCTEIHGDLIIGNDSGFHTDVYNVSPLSNIKVVKGNFSLSSCPILNTANSLSIKKINGSTRITNLNQISNLEFLNDIELDSSIIIYEVPLIEDLNFLQGITILNGDLRLSNLSNALIDDVWEMTTIEGELSLNGMQRLVDLDFLSNLSELQNLVVSNNQNLLSILGLGNIQSSIEGVWIYNNPKLSQCNSDELCDVFQNTNYFSIFSNSADCINSLELLSNCESSSSDCPTIGAWVIKTQTDLENFVSHYPNCTILEGSLSLDSDDTDPIIDLSPLNNFEKIKGNLAIENSEIVNLMGLESLTEINNLSIVGNDKFESFEGLDHLENIMNIGIYENNSLKTLDDLKLNNIGLKMLSIGGNESLVNIEQIRNLDSLEYLTFRGNEALIDYSPIFDIESIETLSIYYTDGIQNLFNNSNGSIQQIKNFRIRDCDSLKSIVLNSEVKIGSTIDIDNFIAKLEEIEFEGIGETLESISIITTSELNFLNLGENLERIEGLFRLSGFTELENLDFKNLTHIGNLQLTSLDNLKSLGSECNLDSLGVLHLRRLNQLTDISVLDRNMQIDSIIITDNALLNDCEIQPICDVLSKNRIYLSDNGSGCNSLGPLFSSCGIFVKNPPGDVIISSWSDIENLQLQYPSADSILGELRIEGAIDLVDKDLNYFKQLDYIQNGLHIENSDIESLECFKQIEINSLHLEELPNLLNIPFFNEIQHLKDLTIVDLLILENIYGLIGVESVSGRFRIGKLPSVLNISGVENIQSINELIFFDVNVEHLDEFENLKDLNELNLSSCNNLNSIKGLSSISNVEFISISDNENLIEFLNPLEQDSLRFVHITNNNQLKVIESFDKIKYFDGWCRIFGNDLLESIHMDSLKYMDWMRLNSNNSLKELHFSSLESIRRLEIYGNGQLEFLGDFSSLKQCDFMEIYSNSNLINIDNFGTDAFVQSYLGLSSNPKLNICNSSLVCNTLSFGTESYISSNGSNCDIEAKVELSCGLNVEECPSSRFVIYNNHSAELYNFYYGECPAIYGDLVIRNNFSVAPNLNNLRYVGERLIVGTSSIEVLNFDNLEFVGRNLQVENTSKIKDMKFPSLTYIKGDLRIVENEDLEVIDQFNSLTNVEDIVIMDNIALNDIQSFTSLKNAINFSVENNSNLISIDGFDEIENIIHIEILENANLLSLKLFEEELNVNKITLESNESLSDCATNGFCIHLDNDRTAIISNNRIGCNSKDEILLNCLVGTTELVNVNSKTKIFPNPADNFVRIENSDKIIEWIRLIDCSGNILDIQENTSLVDLSSYRSGVYFLQVLGQNTIEVFKLIIL